MSKGKTWLEKVIPLDRPEYAKQPEALLTDLIWRSKGSSLSEIKLPRESSSDDDLSRLVRLVPEQINSSKKEKLIETKPFAKDVDVSSLVLNPSGSFSLVKAVLNSLIAPKSRGDKSYAFVPLYPDITAFQTLHGLVNKGGPPDLARVIEKMGWLGGADAEGCVAYMLLTVMEPSSKPGDGFTGFLDYLLPEISRQTWNKLTSEYSGHSFPENWPGVRPQEIDVSGGPSIIAQSHKITPFHWFWKKWSTLCNPQNRWYKVLPARRFTDWATCLLRTGLAFSYLWEANFLVMLHNCISEEYKFRQQNLMGERMALSAFTRMLTSGAALATIESPRIPASQKHAWNALGNMLARGYLIRHELENLPEEDSILQDVGSFVSSWISSLPMDDLQKLSTPPPIDSNTAPNLRDFVRNLLRPRATDDDTQDQADFYYLARSNSRSFWFQPGPEWFVVVTSLLSLHPGGKCTLEMLLDDLHMLGLHVERWILVEMLEEAGLSTDSPDADNALVITSGF